jgi:hypothetical protein
MKERAMTPIRTVPVIASLFMLDGLNTVLGGAGVNVPARNHIRYIQLVDTGARHSHKRTARRIRKMKGTMTNTNFFSPANNNS